MRFHKRDCFNANERGLSFIEVLLVVALVGALAYFLTGLASRLFKAQGQATTQSLNENNRGVLQTLLTNLGNRALKGSLYLDSTLLASLGIPSLPCSSRRLTPP